ncbi:MAG: DUF285 domain-containing protein, partial [Candidatus Peribacteria bacterium]|nr:DUF285 domain-containing protein [Candidatus Peribacteria bacterium]
MFNRANNLVSLPPDAPNLTSVTNMQSTFSYTPLLNQDISNWDVSNVANMNRTFEYASIFNQNISSWNVGSVTDM